MRAAAATLAMVALAWAAWHWAAELAAWAGFWDIDVLWQAAAVFLVLAVAERVASRWLAGAAPHE